MTVLAIEAANLSKTYKTGFFRRGEFEALSSLDLSIGEGEIFAFLGPNGAGKTTTINLLMGFLKPTSGTVRLFGQDPEVTQVRQKLGYLPEIYSFYSYMSAMQLLDYFADLLGISKADRGNKIEKLLTQLDLWQARNRSIGSYSRGMKQRLGIVQALLNSPSLLILDEPTSGFDPAGRKMVRDLLCDLKAHGTSILLSSHILSEVESICDRVAIIDKGRLRRQGTLQEILGTKSFEICYSESSEELDRDINSLNSSLIRIDADGTIVTSDFDLAQKIVQVIVSNGGKLQSLIPKMHTLEDIFLQTIEQPQSEQKSEQVQSEGDL
jgi:ABC-2 type transport system ATP-binding protein